MKVILSHLIAELLDYDKAYLEDIEVKGQITAIHPTHYQILFDTTQDEDDEVDIEQKAQD